MIDWPSDKSKPTPQELSTCVSDMLGGGAILAKRRSSSGGWISPQTAEARIGRVVFTRLLRHHLNYSYPQCAMLLECSHSSLIEACNSPLGQSMAADILSDAATELAVLRRGIGGAMAGTATRELLGGEPDYKAIVREVLKNHAGSAV